MEYQNSLETLAANIQRLRKQYALTQENLADRFGISFQAVSKWENGQACPDIAILPQLADVFHVSIDELFGRKPSRSSAELELPWEDDGVLRGVLWEGRKLLTHTEDPTSLTWTLNGDLGENAHVECWGNMNCQNIDGAVTAGQNVRCEQIQGHVTGGNEIQCNRIEGAITSAGSVNADVIDGDVRNAGTVHANEVHGDVHATGSVVSGKVDGGVTTKDSVQVTGDISGDVTAGQDVRCEQIHGDVKGGKEIQCSRIEGDIMSAGSVNVDVIEGDICSAGAVHANEVHGGVQATGQRGKRESGWRHKEHVF